MRKCVSPFALVSCKVERGYDFYSAFPMRELLRLL